MLQVYYNDVELDRRQRVIGYLFGLQHVKRDVVVKDWLETGYVVNGSV